MTKELLNWVCHCRWKFMVRASFSWLVTPCATYMAIKAILAHLTCADNKLSTGDSDSLGTTVKPQFDEHLVKRNRHTRQKNGWLTCGTGHWYSHELVFQKHNEHFIIIWAVVNESNGFGFSNIHSSLDWGCMVLKGLAKTSFLDFDLPGFN